MINDPVAGKARPERAGVVSKLLVFLVVVFAFIALAWMIFLPALLTHRLRQRSGFDASVAKLAVNPITGMIEVHGFVLTNPPTFPEPDFVSVREFQAKGRVASLLSEHPVFETMLVDVASVTLIKRADGATNAEVFDRNLKHGADESAAPGEPSKRTFLIRHLEVRLDRLTIADHSVRQPTRREFTLNLKQSYVDVTGLDQLLAPSVLKNLAPVATAISGLLPEDVGKVFAEAAGSGKEFIREVGRKTGERAKGFFDALEESKKP